jgi:hypothetical protein
LWFGQFFSRSSRIGGVCRLAWHQRKWQTGPALVRNL